MSLPVGVCVKAAALRPRYDNLAEFLADPKNVLVCRRGRVWITKAGEKTVFVWRDSPFANPFRVGDGPGQYSLSESLRLYKQHLHQLLQSPEVRAAFLQLAAVERIGCFCDIGHRCHRDIIVETLRQLLAESGK